MSQKMKLLPIALGLLSLASVNALAAEALSLQGKTIGVAVVGTQHFWDREAYKGATEEVEKLGGKVIGVDGGRDNQVHANNHDILLSRKVDAVISILGDSAVEPKFKALRDAGIPVFTVDHVSKYSVNNTTSDNYTLGSTIGRYMADELGGKGNVAVFNAFSSSLRICGIRYDQWKYVLKDYPDIHIIQPELAEQFANSPEDARKKTLELLSQYPKANSTPFMSPAGISRLSVLSRRWKRPAAIKTSRSPRSTPARKPWRSWPSRAARSSPTSPSSRT